jgi:hypothetical protein
MLKKIWADPVWSKVISVAILGLIGVLYTSIQGLWPKIFEFFQQCVLLARSSSQVPNWFLLILCIIAVMYIAKIGRAVIYRCMLKEKEEESALKSYTQDLIFDIFWRWTNVNGLFTGLKPYCSKCDYELTPNTIVSLGTHTHFSCDHCKCVVAKFEMSLDDISRRVYREIERKFRTGLWVTEHALPPTTLPTRKFTTIPQPSYGTKWPSP